MKAHLLLENGKYVHDYHIIPPFTMIINEGEPKEWNGAENLKELIERSTDYKNIKVMSNTQDRKMRRRLENRARLIEALRKESRLPVLNIKVIDALKKELENVEKNIQ